MTIAPVIETERLIMRAPCEADLDHEASFYASDRSKHVGGPMTREEVWRAIAALIGHWVIRGYGFWAIDDKETGAYCGRVGLWCPEGWPEPEIGWTMMQAAEGRGIAREAALAARDHAYETLGWSTAISLIAPENARSIALAERIGASLETTFTHERFGETLIYRHPAPEALQ